MNNIRIPTKLTKILYKTKFAVKKHSPEILITSGIIGSITTTVLACKATTKCHEIIEEHNNKMDMVREASSYEDADYTEEDKRKDTTIIYTQTALKFAKLYAPSAILGISSIVSILAGTNIMKKRHMALAAAYATIDKGFSEYRDRVIERFGENTDKELRYNIKDHEIEEKTVDKNGKEKNKKSTVKSANVPEYSTYARIFDETCPAWVKDAEMNLNYIKLQENLANKLLKERGYLFLNEVYAMFGFQATRAGQIIGWYDDGTEHKVDFGLYNVCNESARLFVNGYERSFILDFNVDGDILNMI